MEAGGERGGRALFMSFALPTLPCLLLLPGLGRTAGHSPQPCHQQAGQAGSRARRHVVPRKAVALTVVQDHCCWVCKSRWGGRVVGKLAPSVAIVGCL